MGPMIFFIYSAAWQYSNWGDCSVSCNGGSRSRIVSCTTGDDSDCGDLTKPDETDTCNIQACRN